MMEEIAPKKLAVTKVTLRPKIVFAGAPPDKAKLDDLHHQAHELCFIANSVTTKITVESTLVKERRAGQNDLATVNDAHARAPTQHYVRGPRLTSRSR